MKERETFASMPSLLRLAARDLARRQTGIRPKPGPPSTRAPMPQIPTPRIEVPAVPEIEVVVESHLLDGDRIVAFRDLCGFPAGRPGSPERAPLPYAFVVSFLPQVAVLTHRALPLRALGMVHLHSSLEASAPLVGGQETRITARTLAWRQASKGWEVDTETRIEDAGGRLLALSTATSLALGGGHGESRAGDDSRSDDDPREGGGSRRRRAPRDGEDGAFAVERWRLGAGAGRRYARLSGDYNPIHLWPWTAKILGQPRAIAHGIHLVALSTASLEKCCGTECRRLEVSFKTPAHLPGQCALYAFESEAYEEGGQPGRRFEVWSGDGERPHVFGRCSFGE